MRHFAGAIIDYPGRGILLLKRSATDPDRPGLWSLPAGELEPGEDPAAGLRREVFEETGLIVVDVEPFYKLQKPTWDVTFARCSVPNYDIQLATTDFSEAAYCEGDAIPEDTVLEALLGILKYRTSAPPPAPLTARMVESLISSVFHTYIRRYLFTSKNVLDSDIYRHVILGTPHRKFRSVLPYLLANGTAGPGPELVVADWLFAFFTVVDDLCDNLSVRYGVPTAHHKFGPAHVVTAALRFDESIHQAASMSKLDPALVRKLLRRVIEAEHRRFRGSYHTVDSYLSDSAERTDFAGLLWAAILDAAGFPDEALAVTAIGRKAAELGQLTNDYYDVVPPIRRAQRFDEEPKPLFEDLRRGVESSYVILLKEAGEDVKALAAARDDEVEGTLEREGVTDRIRDLIALRRSELLTLIESQKLSRDKRGLLTVWVMTQFAAVRGAPESSNIGLDEFLRIIRNLTYTAE